MPSLHERYLTSSLLFTHPTPCLSFSSFPASGYRAYHAPGISPGTSKASPVATISLTTMLSLTPRRAENVLTFQSGFVKPLLLSPNPKQLSFRICNVEATFVFNPLRPGSSLTILKYGLVNRLQRLGHPPRCYSSYRSLIIVRAGYSPAEISRLIWTHWGSINFNGIRLSLRAFTVNEITILPFCIRPSRSPKAMTTRPYFLSNTSNAA